VFGRTLLLPHIRFSAIAEQCQEPETLETFSPQGLSNLMWAFGKQGQRADELFERIVPLLLQSASQMTIQSVSTVVWSFAVLGYELPDFFRPLAAVARARIDEFNAQGLANLAWAFAVADVTGSEIDNLFADGAFVSRCNLLIGEAGAFSSAGSSCNEHLRQLHQWELWRRATAQAAAERGEPVWPELSAELTVACADAFAITDARPSDLQRQVFSALVELGFDPEEEVISPEGYSLDIVFSTEGSDGGGSASAGHLWRQQTLIAVEVDGPTHFLHKSTRPSGSTLLKRRQLRQSGWALVSVPYFEWQRAASGARNGEEAFERRKEYLMSQLRSIARDD
jgi:hypothetical protein